MGGAHGVKILPRGVVGAVQSIGELQHRASGWRGE